MRARLRFVLVSLLLVWAMAAPASAAETFQFTVLGIDCKECAPPIVKALNGIKGVQNAKLDWRAGLATVEIPEGFEKAKIKTAIDAIGYEAVFPGETKKDLQPLPDEVAQRLDIVSYDGKQKIDVKGVLAPGKVTILDYWAEWCSPCKFQDARLQHLVMANPKVAVRRVDVGKWDNAAARQATADFRLAALPYARVYDSSGKYVGSVTGGSWDRLLELIERAKARG
jgi:copper chaperone CopZ/thiol-disulfide isomerase/thioredoxin